MLSSLPGWCQWPLQLLRAWLESAGFTRWTWAEVPPIHHASGFREPVVWIVWTFRASFDLMLLQKLRALLESAGLYRQVVGRTVRPPAEERRELMVRNLASTLRETGAFFTRLYVKHFVRAPRFGKRLPIGTRAFAGQTVAFAGVESREYADEVIGLMDEAKEQGKGTLVRDLMTALGRLEVTAEHLSLPRSAAAPLPEPRPGVLWSGNSFGIEFVGIPAGKFTMGSRPEDVKNYPNVDEMVRREARHEVTLTKPFYLARTLVTQEFFQRVTGYNPSFFLGKVLQRYPGVDASQTGLHPVEQVSWFEAQAFCLWLTILERRAGRLPEGWEYRLPTEAQWEYACRADSTTKFCFGDSEEELLEYAWFDKNSEERTHPVGEKKPNAWGLFDMHGNVWEWTGDWFREVMPANAERDPTGPLSGAIRVSRGCSWFNPAENCRAAYRGRPLPWNRFSRLGFRPACVPSRQRQDQSSL